MGNPNAPNPSVVLSDILNGTGYASIQYAYFAATDVTVTSFNLNTNTPTIGYNLVNATTDPTGTVITLNTNALSSIGSGNFIAAAVTLLHELGHVYSDLFGAGSTAIQNDAGNNALSQANTALVQQVCFP